MVWTRRNANISRTSVYDDEHEDIHYTGRPTLNMKDAHLRKWV